MTDHQLRAAPPAPGGPWSAPDANSTAAPHRPAGRRPSEGVRRAWFIPGAILALAALVWGTFNVLDLLAHGQYTTNTAFPVDQVAAVDIANENGSVTVTAADVDEIAVTAEVDDGWLRTGLTQTVVNGVLELRGNCAPVGAIWCNVDFTVVMPADIPLTVDGANGSVTVRGMVAAIDVDSDNGSVSLEDLTGEVRASTDNGRLVGRRLSSTRVVASTDNGRVELSFVDPPDSVDAESDNGRIEIVVPDDEVAYRVEMSTSNGSTDTAVRTDPASDHVIVARTSNGSITVRPPG